MFGGLDIKGSSSKDKKEEKPSGFSFMTGSTPAPAPEAASSSAFSFMSSVAPAAPEPPKAQEQSSSFSFMGGSASAASISSPEPSPSSCGFNFLQTPVPEPKAPQPKALEPTRPAQLTAPSSSYGFMSAASPKTGISSGRTPDAEPVGSGLVFGGVATKKPVKKRSRAQKVGTARAPDMPAPTNAAPPRPSYSAPTPEASPRPDYKNMSPPRPNYATAAPPAVVASLPVPTYGRASSSSPERTANDEIDTKEAAQEAARRAEEFMAQKMMQTRPNASGYVEDYGAASTTPAPSTSVWTRSPEDDDDYAMAKAAAEEAKAKLAAGRQPTDGLMGRLFSRKGPWGPGSTNNTMSGSSQHSTHAIETPAERMQREQEEIKRAVAERQLAMQQEEVPSPRQAQPESPEPGEESETPAWGSSVPKSNSWSRPTVPVSPPPPPKTPAEKLDDMICSFEQKVQRAMERVAQMRDQHKGLLDERLVSLAKERLATQSMVAAEAQQMAAAEAEDYDLADRLAAVIDQHTREKAELHSILDNIGRALAELDSQKQQVVGEVAACFARVKDELQTFCEEQESNDKKDDTESMARFAATSKQLSGENARLLSDAKHLERDEKIVTEERKELEMSISEQTADMEKQRDSARANLMAIEEEIEILRRQLEAKEATAANLRSEVEGHEQDIFKIRDKFARQLGRVEKKEASVRENRYEWEKEKIAHESLKIFHEEEVKAHSQALLEHDELMNKLKKEITLAGTFESIVAKEVVFEKTADQDLESDGDFAQLQANVVKCEAAVSEGKQLVKAAEAALVALKDERDAILKRIPWLEQTKNAAATRRDFKAAGKASKQIKDATARLKECQEELSGEAMERKDTALEQLAKLEEDLKVKRAVANEKEKEAGKAAMEAVAEKIKRLVETKHAVCGGENNQAGVQAVGAFVLNGQIAALVREGSAYGEKYGGWDAIVHELTDACILDTDQPTLSNGGEKSTRPAKEPTSESPSLSKRPPDDVNPEIIALFRDTTRRIQRAEEALDEAVAREDFETAEELNDLLERIKVEWEAIDLTEAEIKIFECNDDTEEVGPEAETEERNAAKETKPSDQSEASDEEDEGDDSDYTPSENESESSEGEDSGGYDSESGSELVEGSGYTSAVEDQPEEDPASVHDAEDEEVQPSVTDADASNVPQDTTEEQGEQCVENGETPVAQDPVKTPAESEEEEADDEAELHPNAENGH